MQVRSTRREPGGQSTGRSAQRCAPVRHMCPPPRCASRCAARCCTGKQRRQRRQAAAASRLAAAMASCWGCSTTGRSCRMAPRLSLPRWAPWPTSCCVRRRQRRQRQSALVTSPSSLPALAATATPSGAWDLTARKMASQACSTQAGRMVGLGAHPCVHAACPPLAAAWGRPTCAPHSAAASFFFASPLPCAAAFSVACHCSDDELQPVAVGIFPLGAMVNPDCSPNPVHAFTGSRMLFR